MPTESPAAVILAAGGSVRMGRSKPLLEVEGRPLISAHVAALAKVADLVIVVVGAQADAVRAVLPDTATAVLNPDWATTWPADSLQIALEVAKICGTCLVTPVDVPPASAETLAKLIAAGAPAVPQDLNGRPGHPVLLDANLVSRIREGAPDGGLRTLLAEVQRVTVSEPNVAEDFDDPEAFGRWTAARGSG